MGKKTLMNFYDKENIRKKRKKIFFSTLFLFISFLSIVPFIWMFMISLKTPIEMMKDPTAFFPKHINFDNYLAIFGRRFNIITLYYNSLKVTLINVFGGIVTSAMAGYAFGRLKFRGRDALFLIYLMTLIIPPEITIIPRFILFDLIGIIDTHLSLILPGLFSVIATFLFRQNFKQIPMELSEAACIDGASEYRIFARVILPLIKPAIMAIFIINFSWHFNDYQSALIFLRRKELYTLPLGINAFADENSDFTHLIAAVGITASLPMILVFLISQKYFIKGIVAGAVKG